MTEVEQLPQNGIDLSAAEEDDINKARPADIEQDMREMERRKRVEAIMGSKLFREELERIVDAAREGGTTGGILQQLSDIVGMPVSRVGNVFKASNCMLPINDIRGVESMGYAKGEKILRCKLAATFRLLDLYGWTQGLGAQITARLKVDQEYFLVNPYGLLYHEITASSLNKVDMQGHIVEQGTTNFGVNKSHFVLHSAVHAARPDIRCAIYIGCSPVVAISSLKTGLLPITKDACVLGEITTHPYSGSLLDLEERDKLVRNLGPNSKVMLLSNHGALCCGETIEEAFFAACHIVQACETQLKLLPVGLDNLVLIPEESRKVIYEQSRRPPEDLEKKFAAATTAEAGEEDGSKDAGAPVKAVGNVPKWRVGGAEYEALMRMLDNAGYRTGYIYRHPLVKSDPPKPKNDVELPPAVSSLGYLLEEEELYRQGIWKKGDLRKGGDRSRWLNSPNVYQKVEVLETGTPDPKKITKWVAEGSPTHSTPVRIEDPLQFVPAGTNPKEFKRLQQQIKDNRRADKISAGPQSHILEGVTWDEANRIKDATVSSAGDHVVLMGAASKGIIQRGYQHNATVYKAPYAKNPFDNVTDDELNEYKRTVERKKKSIHGEYTDTDFSESEPLSSLQTSGAQLTKQNTTTTTTAAVSQSEPEDISEHHVMRIETQQAPVPSQPEVVLSDATLSFLNGERSNEVLNRKPPTGRDKEELMHKKIYNQDPLQIGVFQEYSKAGGNRTFAAGYEESQSDKENFFRGHQNIQSSPELIAEMKNDMLFRRQKEKFKTDLPAAVSHSPKKRGEVHNEDDNDIDYHNSKDYYTDDGEVGNAGSLDSCSAHYQTANETNNSRLSTLPNSSPIKHLHTHSATACGNSATRLPCEHAFQSIVAPRNAECCAYYFEPYMMQGSYEATSYDTYGSLAYGGYNTMHGGGGCGYHSEPENMYKKSIFCYTPAVCDRIFESLQRPSHERSQSLDNDLIFNIPFSAMSPSTSTRATTPRKTRADSPCKRHPNSPCRSNYHSNNNHSPYRTVSHFGFNSPQRGPQPEHKHIPPCAPYREYERGRERERDEPKRYVPVHKSVSYEEIFSSPRYVDLCENCFEKIVRLKPELMPVRMRLRNLIDLPETAPSPIDSFNKLSTELRANSESNEGNDEALCYSSTTEFEYVECNSSDTTETLAPFSTQLEPLIEAAEEEEECVGEQQLKQLDDISIEKTISTSSFIEKIMRMNYSEESTNVNFLQTPRTVSSNLSLEQISEACDMEQQELQQVAHSDPGLCVVLETLRIDERALAYRDESVADEGHTQRNVEIHSSVTEVWEFGDWQTCSQVIPPATSHQSGITSQDDVDTYVMSSARSNVIATIEQEDGQEIQEVIVPAAQRQLMSREERGRRKLEFQEIWEDHIAYFDGRNSLSDTESALDGTTGKQQATQRHDEEMAQKVQKLQEKTNNTDKQSAQAEEIQQNDGISLVPQEDNTPNKQIAAQTESKEVFHGRSLIVKQTKHMPTTTKDAKEKVEKAVVRTLVTKSCSQRATLPPSKAADHPNMLEAPQEEWFFRVPSEIERTPADTALCGMHSEFLEFDRATGKHVEEQATAQYKHTVEEVELCTQQIKQAEVHEARKEMGEDETVQQLGLSVAVAVATELQFDDLLRTTSDEEADDKLSEHFNELLLPVEILQLADNEREMSKNKCASSEQSCKSANYSVESHNETSEYGEKEVKDNLAVLAAFVSVSEEHHSQSSITAAAVGVDAADVEFNPLELKILRKIELHQLRQPENIFDKIETTIRNKLTPSKWQQLLKQKQNENENATTSTTTLDNFAASTPAKALLPVGISCEQSFQSLNLSNINEMEAGAAEMTVAEADDETTSIEITSDAEGQESNCRNALTSRSFTLLSNAQDTCSTTSSSTRAQQQRKKNKHSLRHSCSLTTPRATTAGHQSPPAQLHKTTTPPMAPRKSKYATRIFPETDQLAEESGIMPMQAAVKRNFILENIRNAAKPRHSKRLQGNELDTAPTTLTSCSSHSSLRSESNDPIASVYSFQSKLVRGSPRFWVSMTQTSPVHKHLKQASSSPHHKRRRLDKQKQRRLADNFNSNYCYVQSSDSNCTLDSVGACSLQPSVSVLTFTMSSESEEQEQQTCTSSAQPNVDDELLALGTQIAEIQPRLDIYKLKLRDYGERVAECAHHMDECIEVQQDIAAEQRELRQEVLLNQYMEQVACKAQTYSLSGTED